MGHRQEQVGAALVISMILLGVMSVLGIGSMRGVTLQERMAAATYDRAVAFQAVEAALREAEAVVEPGTNPIFPPSGCNSGLCATPDADDTARWLDPGFSGWRDASATIDDRLGATPQFIVEDMGTAPRWYGCDRVIPVSPYCLAPRYRITARSAASGRASVMLQETYVPD